MSDNLDTNQASEGELKVLLESNGWKFYEELNGFRKESKYTIPMFSTDQQANYDELSAGNYYELKQVIQSAIRTEKLKLLAEVRKRVVGEKDKYNDTYEPDAKRREYKVWQNRVYVSRNELRNEQQTELAKLEAEL